MCEKSLQMRKIDKSTFNVQRPPIVSSICKNDLSPFVNTCIQW